MEKIKNDKNLDEFTLYILLLTNRIYKVMLALKNYGVIPEYYDGVDIFEEELEENIKKVGSHQIHAFDDILPTLKAKTMDEVCEYFYSILNMDVTDENILEHCHKGCGYLLLILMGNTYTNDDKRKFRSKHLNDILIQKAHEAIGYQTAKLKTKISAVNKQGAMSREIGELAVKKAEEILEKCGGIIGYESLPHGKKKPIRAEIESKLKLKDERHVYNIIKRIKDKNKNQ